MTSVLMNYILDGDLSANFDSVPHSTNPREMVTCEMMVEKARQEGVFLDEEYSS